MLLYSNHYVPVAQMDRALDSGSEGRRFESAQAYHLCSVILNREASQRSLWQPC